MKILYAWLDNKASPKGEVLLGGFWLSSKKPSSPFINKVFTFAISKGDTMSNLKEILRRKREIFLESEQPTKAEAMVKLIGSDKNYKRQFFKPLPTGRGYNFNDLMR